MATQTTAVFPKIPQGVRRSKPVDGYGHFTLISSSSGWIYDVLKVNRNLDHEMPTAFCKVKGFATDIGDTYINNILEESGLYCTRINGAPLGMPKPVRTLKDFHECCIMAVMQ